MKNKLIALFTVLLMLFHTVAPVMAMEVQDDKVETKGQYNASAALTYAAEHWNDGVGLCADFVSACLRAGGISVSQAIVGNLLSALESGGYGTKYELRKNGSYFKMSENSDILSPGDPIFYRCHGCEANGNAPYRHVVLCGGSSNDYITYYAHNSAHGNTSTDKLCTYKCSNCGKTNWTFYSYHVYGNNDIPDTDRWNPDNYPVPTRTLYINMSGADVKWLQAVLYQLGYYAQSLGLDGEFGQGTRTAVINFQKDNGLTADGIFGPASRNKMIELLTPYPANPWISVNSSSITVGQSVVFSFGADYATGYTIGINRGSERLVTEDVSGNFSYTPPTTGTYSAYITAWNSRGIVDSGSCTFTVVSPKPNTPTVTVGSSVFHVGDNISIKWTHVDNASYYWLTIYKNGVKYIDQNVYNASSFTQVYNEDGEYTAFVTAWNDGGESPYGSCTFNVLKQTKPTQPVVTVIPGYSSDYYAPDNREFETTTSIFWDECQNTDAYKVYIYNAETEIGWQAFTNIGEPHLNVMWPAGDWYAVVSALNTNTGEYTLSEKAYFSISPYRPTADKYIEYNGHAYVTLVEGISDWHNAKEICERMGGHLATITSEGEQNAVFNLANMSDPNDLWWLGASDEETEGTWKWVTGESFSYTNWNTNQPDNAVIRTHEGEDYLHMYGDNGKWNDINTISNSPRIILELDYTPSTYDANPVASVSYNNHTYSIYTSIIPNWHDVEKFCESKGGTLATITSEEEQQVVFGLADDNLDFGCLWLGATDEKSEGNWEWVTGEPFDYTNWNEGEPSNSGEAEHYMHLYIKDGDRTGKWNDTTENQPFYFILETVDTYTITYRDSITGEVISTATVEHGADAVFPTPPEHEGYTFTGWDSDGKNITADTTITALYEENTFVTLGDVNADGVINGKDVTSLRKRVTGGYNIEIVFEAADINGDGILNGKDVTLLRKLIVGGYGKEA